MKKILSTLVLLTVAAIPSSFSQLATYTFTGYDGTNSQAVPTSPSFTFSDFTRTNVSVGAGSNAFNSASWTMSSSIDLGEYVSFTITPNISSISSYTLTSLLVTERRSNTGIRNWAVRSSVDNYGSNLSLFSVPDTDATRAGQTTSLGLSFANLTSAVTFRFYGWNAEAGTGTWRLDDVVINGSVTPIPEPSTASLVLGGIVLIGALGSRRRRV